MNEIPRPASLSIIVATYNSAEHIGGCLQSIAEQEDVELEVVIVDGKSQDDTLAIVNSFRHRLRILVSSQSDTGIYDAWNRGLGLASGNWLTFLGSDDVYVGTRSLRKLMDAANSRADVPFVYSQLASVAAKGKWIHIHGKPWRDPFGPYQRFVSAQFPFPTMGSIYRKTFFGGDLFDDTYKIAGDLEFFLRRYKKWHGRTPLYVPGVAVEMGMGGISTNDAYYRRALAEDFRFRRELGLSTYNLGLWSNVVKRTAMLVIVRLFGRRSYERALELFRSARSQIRGGRSR